MQCWRLWVKLAAVWIRCAAMLVERLDVHWLWHIFVERLTGQHACKLPHKPLHI